MNDSVSEHHNSSSLPCPAVGNLIDHPKFGRGKIKEIRCGGSQLLVHFPKDDCQRWVLSSEIETPRSRSALNCQSTVSAPDSTSTKIGTIIDHRLLGRGKVIQTRLNSSELLVRFIEDGTTRWIQPARRQPRESLSTTDSIDPRQPTTNFASKSAQLLLHPSTAPAAHDSLFSDRENKDVGRIITSQVADAPSVKQVNGSEEDVVREKNTKLGATGSVNENDTRLPLEQADRVSMAIEALLASRNSPMRAHEIADHLTPESITMREILRALLDTEKFSMLGKDYFYLKARCSRKLDTERNNYTHSLLDSETEPNPELPELMSPQTLRELPFSSISLTVPSNHPKAQSKGVESAIEFEHASNSAIDPEDVIAWLVTQPNANGTLYLENVVRQYMGALRAAPAKLQIPVVFDVRSVFTCHTPYELNAYWDIFKAAPNYKQVNSSTSGMFSAGMGCLLRYLDYLSSTEDTIEDMFFRQAPTPQSGIDVWNENIKQAFQTWLIKVVNYTPKTAQIYASAVARAVRSYRQIAETASSSSDTQAEAVVRFIALLAGDSDYVEANKRGHNQLSAALSAFERFIASESIDTILEETQIITSRKAKPHEPVNVSIAPLLLKQLTDVLSSHFANGYRLNSPIEMARFRIFAAEDLGEELTLTDEELKSYIAACGTTFDGKVYVVSARAKERIKEVAEDYFADGPQAIFFAEFYAKNENWLFEASVVSEGMLIDILRRLFPKLSFTQTYFGYTDASIFAALEGEILRVWGDDVLLTYGQLAERLRYIPLDRIKYLLGQNADFIWSSVETFSHVSRIEITHEERQVIREAAERECNTRGYASITDLPYGEIEERNYELSITAFHNAVYRICLSDKFDKKGKVVTRKGDVLDALNIMKKYCRTIDKCSLDDLLTYEKELTGEVHRWIAMEAGNTVLVRIDKNTYVADRYVHFNADIIDEAIGLFVEEEYLPLKSFTTFGAFPQCGQTWNLFLLESYCRRFSRKFRFDTLTLNSRNAGAVIRKSCGMDYTEIMTDAVANADVPLKDTAVGKFLYESGYTGRSTTTKVNEIIDKAKAIREMRD